MLISIIIRSKLKHVRHLYQVCSALYLQGAKKYTGDIWVNCDYCKKVLCRTCSGVNSTEIRALNVSSRIIIPSICKDCVTQVKQLLKLADRVSAIEENLNEIKVGNSQQLDDFEFTIQEIRDEKYEITICRLLG